MKEETSVAELKRSIAELQSSASALADLLARIRDEGQTLNEDWQWVEDFLNIVRSFDQKLSEALRARDPRLIHYAASNFVSLRKYFSDLPPDWSKLYKELVGQVSKTTEQAGKVAFAINPFDASSLAEIQRSL